MILYKYTVSRQVNMEHFPPGEYVSLAMRGLPAPGPDSVLQTVEIDALRWGRYRITFIAVQNPGEGCGTGSGRCTTVSGSISASDEGWAKAAFAP